MTKHGLSHPEHMRLGQVLSGIRAQLLREQEVLERAYPRTGPRALAAKQLEAAREAVEEARVTLERELNGEHPALADPTDYYPYAEHRAEVVVPEKPGSSVGQAQFGG